VSTTEEYDRHEDRAQQCVVQPPRHADPGRGRSQQGAGDGADAPGGVATVHDGPAQPAPDGHGVRVHRHVERALPGPEDQLEDDQRGDPRSQAHPDERER